MEDAVGHTAQLQHWLGRMREGDALARNQLLAHAGDRLRRLTRKMLRRFPALRRWEQTDDVLQNATLRLHRALADVRPESARHFYNLAAVQIRRELLDLTKHHFGPLGQGAHHHTDEAASLDEENVSPHQLDEAEAEPDSLEGWTKFHEAVEALPEEEKEVFNLLWYEGLDQPEAATVLGASLRTVKRRWQKARLLLYAALHEEPPR